MKRTLGRIIAVVLVVLAIAAALADVRAFVLVIPRLRLFPLAFSIVATAGSYLAVTAMFVAFARAASVPLTFRDALPASFVSQAVNNQLSTGGAGGLALRVFGFGRRGLAPGKAAAVSVLGGLAGDLCMNVVLFAAAGALAFRPGAARAALATLLFASVSAAIIAVLVLAVLHPRWREKMLGALSAGIMAGARRLGMKPDLARASVDFIDTVAAAAAHPRRASLSIITGLADAAFRTACLGFAFAAVGAPQPLVVIVAAYGAGVVGGGLSMIPGGLGATEASMAGIVVLLGVDLPTALAAGAVFRLTYFVVPLLPALLLLPAFNRAPLLAPGPSGGLLLGNLRALRRDPLAFYESLAPFGRLARFRAGPFSFHLVNDPVLVREVLLHDGERWRKGWGNEVLRPLIGSGVFLAEGEAWKVQRKTIGPLFKRENLASLHDVVIAETDRMLDEWCAKPGFHDVDAEVRRLTLRITSIGLIGADLFAQDPDLANLVGALWSETNRRLARGVPLLDRLPLPSNRRYAVNLARLDGAVSSAIAAFQPVPGRITLLDVLREARGPAGETLTAAQIRDEVITILLAGHECTSIALSWSLYLLARHPAVTRSLEEEAGERAPTFEEAMRLGRTRATLEEAMRLYPPAWMISRQANVDVELGGIPLRKNSIVLISPWVLQRSAAFFPEPLRFDPARPAPAPYTWIPFGAGARACAGRPFAMSQGAAILARILQRVRFAAPLNTPIPDPGLTLRPRGGIWLRISSRAGEERRGAA